MKISKALAFLLVMSMLVPLVISAENVSATSGTTIQTPPTANLLGGQGISIGPFYSIKSKEYYVFYANTATSLGYTFSSDGLTGWSVPSSLYDTGGAGLSTVSVCVDVNGDFHLGYYATPAIGLKYARLAVNAGNGTISESSSSFVSAVSSPNIVDTRVGSDGHIWVMLINATHIDAWRNSNSVSTSLWTTSVGFPITFAAGMGGNARSRLQPDLSGGMYDVYNTGSGLIYIQHSTSSGTVWGAAETASAHAIGLNQYVDSFSDGSGNVWIAYSVVTSGAIDLIERRANGTYAPELVMLASSTGKHPSVMVDGSNVYVIWTAAPTANHFYYRIATNGVLSGAVDWLDESVDAGVSSTYKAVWGVPQNNKLFMAYDTKPGSPFNLKVAYLTLTSLPVANFSADHVSGTLGLDVTFTDSSTNTPTNWTWDFGDSHTSYLENPSHVYSLAGTYTVSLRASNSAGADYENKTGYIVVVNPAPTIVTTAVTSAVENSAYFYDANASQDGTWSIITNASWVSFAVPSGVASGIPNNTAVGIYAVYIMLTNSNGTAYQNFTLTVVNVAPVFTSMPVTIGAGEAAYIYDANTDQEGYGVVYSLVCSSPQLSINSSTGVVSGKMPNTPSVTVSICANDSHGGVTWQNYTVLVTMISGAIRVHINWVQDKSTDVKFWIVVEGGDELNITSTRWNFGDGVGSVEFTPAHSYHSLGAFAVTVEVVDRYGRWGYDTQLVSVGASSTVPISHDAQLWQEVQMFLTSVGASLGLCIGAVYSGKGRISRKQSAANSVALALMIGAATFGMTLYIGLIAFGGVV